jgi:hypothetical protein
MLSIVIVVLLVVVFIITFVVPLARRKVEGFRSERDSMIQVGRRTYNDLGISLDPILPTFAVASTDLDNTNLTNAQYLNKFNSLTNKKNIDIQHALVSPTIDPTIQSTTNIGLSRDIVENQLPLPNDLLLKARFCEKNLKGRSSCSQLDDPKYAECGVCIDAGTRFNGGNPDTFIGGLLSLKQDRDEAYDDASGKNPAFYPSLGKCPPGMFYVDSASCKKAVNQINCKEIGQTGGFQGGRTKEGLKIPTVSCAQAPVADEFVYQPENRKYDVNLRFLAPFGTGLNIAVVTHVPTKRTFRAQGNGGEEFTLLIRGVQEQDQVDILVAQEVPHRPNGKAEVFQAIIPTSANSLYKIPKDAGPKICERIGTQIATNGQVANAYVTGLQSRYCGRVADKDESVYAIQSGIPPFSLVGNRSQSGFCDAAMEAQGVGVWCYGFKPTKSTNTTIINTVINDFFQSFGTDAQPAQDSSIYSQYSTPESNDPPGVSQRAILIQWEMVGSKNRIVSFQPTITEVNGMSLKTNRNTLRMFGPFSKSSLIRGPAWNSKSTMQKSQFWFWSNISKSTTATFSAIVPAYLADPYYADDTARVPIGPLISNPVSANLLKTSPCFADNQAPGKYSISCLLDLFHGAGGDSTKGTLAKKDGGLVQLNKYGDLSDISAYLDNLYITATSGKDSNGNVISFDMKTRIAAMNDAAMKLFGFNITNPCEDLVDNPDGSVGLIPKPMGNVTADCLQYLWLNNGSDEDRKPGTPAKGLTYKGTYTSIADRFSGLRNNESVPKKRDQYPFQACQTGGSMAPIKNGQVDQKVVSKLTNMGSLQAVQNYFNDIQKSANYGTDPDIQATAVQQCYGIKQAKKPTCGVLARFVRIDASDQHPGENCIQISQLAVFDNNGVNVALNKPTNGSSPSYQPESNSGNAVDGVMAPRAYPKEYHSGVGPNSTGNPRNCGDNYFWIVDLQQDYDITKVVYYNRSDCCSHRARGMKLKLLDASQNVIVQKIFPNGNQIIPFDFTNPNASADCNINSSATEPPSLSIAGPFSQVIVNGVTYYLITGNATVTTSGQANVNYFAVGGGGGAGNRNGGGAGGLQTNVSGIAAFRSQFINLPLVLSPGKKYAVSIGAGGGGSRQQNGGNTTFTGDSITPIVAIGGAYGGATGQYCSAPNGGCGGGGGGCASVGTQGGSTNGPNGSPITNSGAGIGGAPADYWLGGPGISYIDRIYGAGSPDAKISYNAPANSGNGGSSGGAGGSGIFILSIP